MTDKNSKHEVKEYNDGFQKLFLEMMLGTPELYVRVQNLYKIENFSRANREVAKFIKDHADNYKSMPTIDQISAVTGESLQIHDGITSEHEDWFLNEFESFSRRQELERAILKSADYLEKGEFGPVEKLIKDAVQIGLVKDIGTDYFADPKGRLKGIKARNNQVSTGWPILDKFLYGGMNHGELNLLLGGSGCVIAGTMVEIVEVPDICSPSKN